MTSVNRKKWIFFLLSWLGMAIYFTERWVYGPMIPYLMTDFGIDRTYAGIIGSAHILGFLFMPVLAGFISDRIGRKPVILAGLSGISFFTCLSGFTRTPAQMVVTRFLTGVTEPLFFVPLMAYFVELFPNYPGFFLTLMISGTSIGWFVGPLLSGWCLGSWGSWRYPFWIAGASGFLLLSLLSLCWYDREKSVVSEPMPSNTRSVRKTVSGVLIVLSLAVMFNALSEFSFSIWLPSFLKEERHFPITQVGIISSMWGIGQFFGRPLLCLLGDRIGYRRVGIPAAFAMGLSFFQVIHSQFYASLIFWQLAAGFVGGAVMGSIWTFTAILFAERKGTALGFVSNVGGIGSFAAPFLGGYIGDRYPLRNALLIIGILPTFVSGVLFASTFFWVRRKIKNSKNG